MASHHAFKKAQEEQKRRGYQSYRGKKLTGARTVVSRHDTRYPSALHTLASPPKSLYVVGNLDALGEGLSIIGARRATPYGIGCAQRFASLAARRGICIISGGARGCDAASHKAALDAGGTTVAVLGGGCDELYPASHYQLFQDIIDSGGAVISEHEWDFPPLPYTFRARNRIIAGLAKATLIVEAGLPSGTFSTADEALNASKDVWVVPGAITSKTSAGANQLLYQGAQPVINDESFDTLLSSLFGLLRQEQDIQDAPDMADDPLLASLMAQPMRFDEILRKVPHLKGKGTKEELVQMRIIDLESRGIIARYPDGRYGPTLAR